VNLKAEILTSTKPDPKSIDKKIHSEASLWRNQETKVSTIEAMIAVVKEVISKPVTNLLVSHKRATLIKKAVIPKVRIDNGRAISWRIGLIKVLTIPITIAATTATQRLANLKPGTRYSTTNKAKTLIANLIINFILLLS